MRDSCNLWKRMMIKCNQASFKLILIRAAHIHESGVQVFDVLVDVAVVLQEMLRRLGHLLPFGLHALGLCVEVEAKILVYGRGHLKERLSSYQFLSSCKLQRQSYLVIAVAHKLLLQHVKELHPALVGVLLLKATVLRLFGEPREGVVKNLKKERNIDGIDW